jgi:hypothetical protein
MGDRPPVPTIEEKNPSVSVDATSPGNGGGGGGGGGGTSYRAAEIDTDGKDDGESKDKTGGDPKPDPLSDPLVKSMYENRAGLRQTRLKDVVDSVSKPDAAAIRRLAAYNNEIAALRANLVVSRKFQKTIEEKDYATRLSKAFQKVDASVRVVMGKCPTTLYIDNNGDIMKDEAGKVISEPMVASRLIFNFKKDSNLTDKFKETLPAWMGNKLSKNCRVDETTMFYLETDDGSGDMRVCYPQSCLKGITLRKDNTSQKQSRALVGMLDIALKQKLKDEGVAPGMTIMADSGLTSYLENHTDEERAKIDNREYMQEFAKQYTIMRKIVDSKFKEKDRDAQQDEVDKVVAEFSKCALHFDKMKKNGGMHNNLWKCTHDVGTDGKERESTCSFLSYNGINICVPKKEAELVTVKKFNEKNVAPGARKTASAAFGKASLAINKAAAKTMEAETKTVGGLSHVVGGGGRGRSEESDTMNFMNALEAFGSA